MGNDSGELGCNIMDYYFKVGVWVNVNDFEDKYYKGCWFNGFYILRFWNLGGKIDMLNFKRGYGY